MLKKTKYVLFQYVPITSNSFDMFRIVSVCSIRYDSMSSSLLRIMTRMTCHDSMTQESPHRVDSKSSQLSSDAEKPPTSRKAVRSVRWVKRSTYALCSTVKRFNPTLSERVPECQLMSDVSRYCRGNGIMRRLSLIDIDH